MSLNLMILKFCKASSELAPYVLMVISCHFSIPMFFPQTPQHIPLSDLSTLSHAKTRILHTVSMMENAL
uniref:Uncharacterized protein n=1 Tax=Crocodylus porosus TaxID=8502 RepID=A0A7M4FXA6_CROPO